MFVGRVSAEAIGAVSLGGVLFYTIGIFASGLLLGLDTLVSQAHGAGDFDDGRRSLVNGVWLALLLIPAVMGIVWAFVPALAIHAAVPLNRSFATAETLRPCLVHRPRASRRLQPGDTA